MWFVWLQLSVNLILFILSVVQVIRKIKEKDLKSVNLWALAAIVFLIVVFFDICLLS